MRVAALYDIHGNLPALEAVLEEVRRAQVDQIVIGGDIVPGPMPRETIDCLRSLEVPMRLIRGNGDREVLAYMRGIENPAIPQQYQDVMRWNAQQLQPEDEDLLGKLPLTLQVRLEEIGEVLFCHATPTSDTEIFTSRTPDDRLADIFAGLNVSLVICGHTHMQFDRNVGTVRVVNAGSVGMPFAEPGAYWALLGPDVELRQTSYDLVDAARRIRATAYPQADDFAARNILQPPSEAEMLKLYSKAK